MLDQSGQLISLFHLAEPQNPIGCIGPKWPISFSILIQADFQKSATDLVDSFQDHFKYRNEASRHKLRTLEHKMNALASRIEKMNESASI